MAIALVSGQSALAFAASPATTVNVVLTNNPTAGNLVVVGFLDEGAAGTLSVADSNSNSYTAAGTLFTVTVPGNGRMNIFYLVNAPANASKTITCTTTSGANLNAFAAEFSGAVTSSPLDGTPQTASAGANNTAITTPSITTTVNGDLIFGLAFAGGTITAVGGSFTFVGGGADSNGNAAEWMVQSTAGAQAVNYTQSPSALWSGMVAAFKAAATAQTPYQPYFQQMLASRRKPIPGWREGYDHRWRRWRRERGLIVPVKEIIRRAA